MKSASLPSLWLTFAVLNGLIVSAQATTGVLGDAKPITDDPKGAVYIAKLPTSKGVLGSVVAKTPDDGQGTLFTVDLENLPSSGGPFLYHIHQYPVPSDGNCTGAGAHLDPYQRGETPSCDSTAPQTCQVGDLSGKHGQPAGPNFEASYVDSYASLNPLSNAYLGNLSVVVHFANKTRITCANFTLVQGGIVPPASTSSSSVPVLTKTATSSYSVSVSTGKSVPPTGTVTGASTSHSTGAISTATVVHSSDGAIIEWRNLLLTMTSIFAITLIL